MLSWDGLPLRLEELEKFLKHSMKFVYLAVRQVHLLSGTWADVLDVLHDASTQAIIEIPMGAECDDMSRERIEEFFGSGCLKRGKSEWYMRGFGEKIKDNPLRKAPAEDRLRLRTRPR